MHGMLAGLRHRFVIAMGAALLLATSASALPSQIVFGEFFTPGSAPWNDESIFVGSAQVLQADGIFSGLVGSTATFTDLAYAGLSPTPLPSLLWDVGGFQFTVDMITGSSSTLITLDVEGLGTVSDGGSLSEQGVWVFNGNDFGGSYSFTFQTQVAGSGGGGSGGGAVPEPSSALLFGLAVVVVSRGTQRRAAAAH